MQNEAPKSDAAASPAVAPPSASSGPALLGKNPVFERWRWQVFFVTWLAYAGFYLTRKSFSVAKVSLGDPQGMGWTESQLAWIDFVYLVAYAIGQFVWGASGDKYGTRKVILIGMMASIVAAIFTGASSTVVLLGFFFCIQGLCQSTGWAPLAKNVGEFFSQRERGRVMGLWCTNYAAGGFAASALAGVAAAHYGWRYAFWVPAAVLLIVWLLFLFLQTNRPEDVGLESIEKYHGEPAEVIEAGDKPSDEPEGSWKVIREVLRSPMVWLLAAVYFFIKQPRYFILNWGALFVKHQLALTKDQADVAATLSGMFDLAGPAGVILGGYMSDRLFRSKRMPMSIIGLLGAAAILCGFGWLPPSRLVIGLGFFAVGFLLYIPDSLVSATAAIDFGTKKGASTAAGIINGFGSIGAILGGTLPGWISQVAGNGANLWTYGFIGLGLCLVAAAMLLLPQWNTLPPNAAESQKKTS